MKKIILLTIVALTALSCTNESATVTPDALTKKSTASNAKAAASTSNFSDYNIVVTASADGSEWTYTITKAKSTAKTLSHFIISLDNCEENSATFSDVIWASVNGVKTDLSTSEGSGTGCNPQATTTNFIKFPSFSDATSWVVIIKFDRGYAMTNGTAWIKAGSSCDQCTIPAPCCPKEAR